MQDTAKDFVLQALIKYAVEYPDQDTSVELRKGPGRNQTERIWLNVDGCRFIVEVKPWISS